jgi:hypothetical protein
MMMPMPSSGVQIRLAEGGYIVQWMESRKARTDEGGGEPKGYLEQEQHGLSGCLPGQRFMPPRFKCAVRVKLEDALKLAGEVLFKLQEIGVDEDELGGPGSFIAGA